MALAADKKTAKTQKAFCEFVFRIWGVESRKVVWPHAVVWNVT
jgi:preprotein translocase subunit SecE